MHSLELQCQLTVERAYLRDGTLHHRHDLAVARLVDHPRPAQRKRAPAALERIGGESVRRLEMLERLRPSEPALDAAKVKQERDAPAFRRGWRWPVKNAIC